MNESSNDGEPPLFYVLLGPDYAGKSSTMTALAREPSPWRFVSVDDEFTKPGHGLVGELRRRLLTDALPALNTGYSADFIASLMQTAVVHLRDQIVASAGPVLVDSYYYKILAKCLLAGGTGAPIFDWWRSFPQPARVLYLDVSPATAWRRCGAGARLNRLEHYGEPAAWPGFEAYQADLDKLLRDEVRHLPVTVIGECDGVDQMVDDVRRVLMSECA